MNIQFALIPAVVVLLAIFIHDIPVVTAVTAAPSSTISPSSTSPGNKTVAAMSPFKKTATPAGPGKKTTTPAGPETTTPSGNDTETTTPSGNNTETTTPSGNNTVLPSTVTMVFTLWLGLFGQKLL